MPHDRRQVDVDCVVVPSRRAHRLDASGDADRDKADSRLDQTPRDQCILAPFIPILRDQPGIFLGEIKCLSNFVRRQDFDSRSIKLIHRFHHAAAIDVAADAIELPQQAHAVVEAFSFDRQCGVG